MQRQEPSAPMPPSQLRADLAAGRPVRVVDVRDRDEFAEWQIPGALHVPLDRLTEDPSVVPADEPVVIVCAHGVRSAKAAQRLRERGIQARSLEGGMVAWNGQYQSVEITSADALVLQFQRLGKGCLSYLLVSDGEAVVIDPTIDVREYIDAAAAQGGRITRVVDTHAHADHASGARSLVEETGARYHAPTELGDRVTYEPLQDGDELRVGRAALRAMATPGHTPGSLTILFASVAFTGDTLFVESVGRPDLGQEPAPNAEILHRSLHARILTLPDTTRILPAHTRETMRIRDPIAVSATLGSLRSTLEPLHMAKNEFVDWVKRHAGPPPESFEKLKALNRGERSMPDLDELREWEAGPNRCAV